MPSRADGSDGTPFTLGAKRVSSCSHALARQMNSLVHSKLFSSMPSPHPYNLSHNARIIPAVAPQMKRSS